ncbi:MAG: hypothetical protein JXA42_10040 [Anaerolineales bacterium]|nr:hypothetical protein [Anaerolineales bacterium]
MSHEQPMPPSCLGIHEVYGLNDGERYNGRVSHQRFQEILIDKKTNIHKIAESCNNYGEFLFITSSRLAAGQPVCITFFGLGYHEYRERWITDEWFWYRSHPFSDTVEKTISKDKVIEAIQQRLENISAYVGEDLQSSRGKFFEMLADLTDEDGALADLQDFDDLGLFYVE